MAERDDDIEFDFFDEEPATQETASRPRVIRAPKGPRRPVGPPGGLTPLLRLIGLIAAAILIVVLLVFWVQSCRGADKRDAYRGYMDRVNTLAGQSQSLGRQLTTKINTPGVKQADLERAISGFAQQQSLDVEQAQGLDPPGPLRAEHEHMVEALQLRVSGLNGLVKGLQQTAKFTNSAGAGRLLAGQADRLVASDVVWDDLFKDPAKAELKSQDVGGVPVPNSDFVQNRDLASATSMTDFFKRLHGASTGGATSGVHGTGIVSVRVLPSGQELSRDTETVVLLSTRTAIEVSVENGGDSQEVGIPVTLTIPRPSGRSIVLRKRIDVISPKETVKVVFRNIGQPDIGPRTPVRVDVRPVAQEKSRDNNSAEFPVVFSV